MTTEQARALKEGDYVLVHCKQFLSSCRPARWTRARVEEVRQNPTRREVLDVIVRVGGSTKPLWCSGHELRRAAQKTR
jgi:hypothetical protein